MRSSSLRITCRISWTSISSVLNVYIAPSLFLQASSLIPVYTVSYRQACLSFAVYFYLTLLYFPNFFTLLYKPEKTINLSLKCSDYISNSYLCFYTFFYPQPHLHVLNLILLSHLFYKFFIILNYSSFSSQPTVTVIEHCLSLLAYYNYMTIQLISPLKQALCRVGSSTLCITKFLILCRFSAQANWIE